MSKRGKWATRFGIYLAAIGSAFGLGGLWRFPYVVSENGGGAFVVVYFFLLILIGIPLLIGELLIGKITRRGVLAGQRQLVAQAQSSVQNKRERPLIWAMPILALICIFSCVVILGYYSVISGWVLHFLIQFLSMPFSATRHVEDGMGELLNSGWMQLLLASIHVIAVSVVVAKGVEEGIEKWVGFFMPLFVGIMVVLVFNSLSLSSSIEALRYFLYPDFSKLNISSLGAAIGQVCFTLSIGFATMVTFGSYLQDETVVPRTGFRVAALDSASALMAGLLIFPLVLGGQSYGNGLELLFESVPEYLAHFEGGLSYGIFFFICLYMAAFGASISILETIVANISENSKLSRGKVSFFACVLGLAACVVPALSSTLLKGFTIGGHSVLAFIDLVIINWIVPTVALVFSQIIVYEVSDKLKKDEFLDANDPASLVIYNHWCILMKWVVPPVLITGLVLQFVGLFL